MATSTLSFNLEDPEDAKKHLLAVKSLDLALAIECFDKELRDAIKYSEDINKSKCAEHWKMELYEWLNSYGIDLSEML